MRHAAEWAPVLGWGVLPLSRAAAQQPQPWPGQLLLLLPLVLLRCALVLFSTRLRHPTLDRLQVSLPTISVT